MKNTMITNGYLVSCTLNAACHHYDFRDNVENIKMTKGQRRYINGGIWRFKIKFRSGEMKCKKRIDFLVISGKNEMIFHAGRGIVCGDLGSRRLSRLDSRSIDQGDRLQKLPFSLLGIRF